MKRLALATVAGLLSSTALVHAADIAVEAPIRAVTVYPAGASVTRDADFTVPVGVSTIIIGNIAPGIDTSTVRVEGLADAGLEIRSVETQQAKADDTTDPERERIEAAIEELRNEQLVLNDQMTALSAQRTFIQNLINEGPAGFADNLGNGGGIEQWAAAWQAIGQGMERVLTGIREVQQQSRAIDEQIAALFEQAAALPQPRVALEIRIEVSATAQATGTLEATYQVTNARWTPAYDAMLTTGDETTEPSIEIIRRAEITQSTGDDWTDVQMTLSTSRPSGGTAAPVLGGAFLRVYDYGRYAAPTAVPAPAPALEARALGGAADMIAPIIQQQAVADFGDFRANFIIPGPVSVVSGGGVRSVRLATDAAEARLFATATPRIAEQAFLTAAFTLDLQAPLLAGNANLFRDGSYVGMGRVAFANPGAEVELGFGPDDQVRVVFTLASRESGQRGLLTRIDTDERHYEITVDNLHTRPMEITVIDRVPVAEDERITVEQLDTTAPTETDVDGVRGVLAWTYDYEPGETRTITNGYLVTWPSDLDVTGLD